MTWKDQLARLNTSLVDEARGLGESCTLYLRSSPDGVLISAVLAKVPTAVDATGAWEDVPTASVMAADCHTSPRPGDILVEDSGPRWIVDRADREDDMWRLTLRSDPMVTP